MFFPAHRIPAVFSSVRRMAVCAALAVCCAGCTPQQMLVSALVPDGTASVLLGHLREVPAANRQRIAELEQKGDWAGLAKFAEDNIARDAFSPEWRMIAGYARLQLGDPAGAIVHFSEQVRLSPDDAAGYHFLAGAQRAAGQPERAVATLERALLVVRESAATYYLLGEANDGLSRHVSALAAYRRALAIDSMMAGAWFGAGRSALRLARTGEAREALQALEKLHSPLASQLKAMMAD